MKIAKVGKRAFGLAARVEDMTFLGAQPQVQKVVTVDLIEMIDSCYRPGRTTLFKFEGIAVQNPLDRFSLRKGLHLAAEQALDFADIRAVDERKRIHDMIEDYLVAVPQAAEFFDSHAKTVGN